MNSTLVELSPTGHDIYKSHIYSIPVAITCLIMSVFGVLGNALIIVAVLTTKELKNRCQFLIAYLALVDLIASAYYCSIRIFIFNYMYFMSNYQCFIYSIYGLFSMNVQTGLTVVLGFDRLLAVAAPHSYRHWNAKIYLLICTIPPNIYAIIITGYGLIDADHNKIVPVCMPPTAYNKDSSNVWVFSNGVIVLLVLFVYGLANAFFIRSNRGVHSDTSTRTMKRVLMSLTVVMLVYVFTWAFTMLMMFLIAVWLSGSPAEKVIQVFLAYPVIINSSSNVIIYAWRSYDTRRAFVRILRLKKVVTKIQKISPFAYEQTIMTTTQTDSFRRTSTLSISANLQRRSSTFHQ